MSPADFIPEVPGWRDRSRFIRRSGPLSFHHYDFYSQALSKLERRHARDLTDVRSMFDGGLIEAARLIVFLEMIEPLLFRYPAIDSRAFHRAVLAAAEGF